MTTISTTAVSRRARRAVLVLATGGVVAALGLAAMPAPAAAAEYYSGKSLKITVSSDSGGGYDTYTRLLARHLPQHIPGNPAVIVQNMPGAGGLRSAQFIYDAAPKDGSILGNIRASNMLDSILGIRGTGIDPTKYVWVGSMASDTDVCSFWHTAGIHSFDDLLKKEVVIGASGKSSQAYTFPSAINNILGTKMKIVVGYKGASDRILAVEQGELQGNCGLNGSTITSHWPKLLKDGKLIPIMQSGLKPYPALPNVPLTQSFAKTDEQKKILTTLFSQMQISRAYAGPPGLAPEAAGILRKAFADTLKDPAFLADARKTKVDIDLTTGEETARIVAEMADTPEQLKQKLKDALTK